MGNVQETLKKILDNIKERWLQLARTTRIIVLSVFAAVVVAIVVLIIIFSQTGYVVLYSGMTNVTERSEVLNVVQNDLGITEIMISGEDILIAAEYEDTARLALSSLGYPQSTYNYNHWTSNIGMFSTDTQTREIERQQLEMNMAATLSRSPKVDSVIVLVTLESEDPYVLESQKSPASVAVSLKLKSGQRLTNDEINGVYNLVQRSIRNLSSENISVHDENYVQLIAEDAPSEAENLALYQQQMQMSYQFQREYTDMIKQRLEEFLDTAVGSKYSVGVNVLLEYGAEKIHETIYTPSVDDSGMVSSETNQIVAGGIAAEGEVIGTEVNADITPDVPTIVADGESEIYYEYAKETQYLVNELIREYESPAWRLQEVSVALALDDNTLTAQELEDWQRQMAMVAGTSVELVSVQGYSFSISQNVGGGPSAVVPTTTDRSMLIFVIILLGALLVVLFFLAIMTTGSKKRRHVRARLAAAAAGMPMPSGTGMYEDEVFGRVTATPVGEGAEGADRGEGGFDLPSLLDTGGETREGVLKTEIREFAKSNPEIVAQLIRTWMKE